MKAACWQLRLDGAVVQALEEDGVGVRFGTAEEALGAARQRALEVAEAGVDDD